MNPLETLRHHVSGAIERDEAVAVVEKRADTYQAEFEHTDTFGGEANYCWVRREDVTLTQGTTDLAIVRRLKAFAGFTGLRCRVENYGDQIRVTPIGRHAPCQTAFFTVRY